MSDYEPFDLKNIYVSGATRDHIETILSLLELEFVTIPSPRDLVAMLRQATDIPTDQRQSLCRAFLVLRAMKADGITHYVATEAAYTADRGDADRTLHTALCPTRCTGCPAHAVISSIKNGPEVLVDAGTVHWLRLTHKDLNPDGRGPALRPEHT
ncbi:MAG: hypothetical protein OXC13_06275 [Caldilineaceae bacterium]|nr:hypothetical protein [Caldilineaceae bacterium]